VRCRVCSAEFKPGLNVCPECGATIGSSRLSSFVHCRSCQRRAPGDLRVCPYCGSILRSGWRLPLLIAVGAIIVGGMAYGLSEYLPWTTLRAAVEDFEIPAVAFLVTPTATPSQTPTPTRPATRSSLVAPAQPESSAMVRTSAAGVQDSVPLIKPATDPTHGVAW
jgi:RNA polymerase subunit RPABC4/transcription elongation factor Spt4